MPGCGPKLMCVNGHSSSFRGQNAPGSSRSHPETIPKDCRGRVRGILGRWNINFKIAIHGEEHQKYRMNYISAYFFAYFLLASKINRIFATDNGYYRPDYRETETKNY